VGEGPVDASSVSVVGTSKGGSRVGVSVLRSVEMKLQLRMLMRSRRLSKVRGVLFDMIYLLKIP
jgi:hypothetical protein